jgi:hypothetical protein
MEQPSTDCSRRCKRRSRNDLGLNWFSVPLLPKPLDALALILDRQRPLPTLPSPLGLVMPSEQVREEHRHAAFEFALCALAHPLDLLGDVLEIPFLEASGTQRRGLAPSAQTTMSVSQRMLANVGLV